MILYNDTGIKRSFDTYDSWEFTFLVFVFFLFGELKCQEYPVHTITNGIVTAQIYLPDQDKGFYKATRFDWSGIIGSLIYQGIDYFGQWYSKHNPRVNDAISGPVEEFNEIGYECIEDEDEFLESFFYNGEF